MKRGRGKVLILDSSSEHVTHVWKKTWLFEEEEIKFDNDVNKRLE